MADVRNTLLSSIELSDKERGAILKAHNRIKQRESELKEAEEILEGIDSLVRKSYYYLEKFEERLSRLVQSTGGHLTRNNIGTYKEALPVLAQLLKAAGEKITQIGQYQEALLKDIQVEKNFFTLLTEQMGDLKARVFYHHATFAKIETEFRAFRG